MQVTHTDVGDRISCTPYYNSLPPSNLVHSKSLLTTYNNKHGYAIIIYYDPTFCLHGMHVMVSHTLPFRLMGCRIYLDTVIALIVSGYGA